MHKMPKVMQKCQKWCKNAKSGAMALTWRKTAQKAEIFQIIIYMCFLEDTGIYESIYLRFIPIYPGWFCFKIWCVDAGYFDAFFTSHVPSWACSSTSPFNICTQPKTQTKNLGVQKHGILWRDRPVVFWKTTTTYFLKTHFKYEISSMQDVEISSK